MGRSRKGSHYERETCRQLSEWWCPGRDDIFWRTASSGGRATRRTKVQRKTFGQYGDLQAVDPIGAPLMKLITFELKRGYTRRSAFSDAIDRTPLAAQKPWEEFMEQTITAAADSGTRHWALIQRRDDCTALIFFPRALFIELKQQDCNFSIVSPFVQMRFALRKKAGTVPDVSVCAVRLTDFLRIVTPDMIRALATS